MSRPRRSYSFNPSTSFEYWDPFGYYGSSFSVPQSRVSYEPSSASAGARVDWKETTEAHVFMADLPGLKKEEVKVEVEEGRWLQISGERKRERAKRTDIWYNIERSSGRFLRRFYLPENAKVERIRAAMENGVLTVTVPKEEVKKVELKSIEIFG